MGLRVLRDRARVGSILGAGRMRWWFWAVDTENREGTVDPNPYSLLALPTR